MTTKLFSTIKRINYVFNCDGMTPPQIAFHAKEAHETLFWVFGTPREDIAVSTRSGKQGEHDFQLACYQSGSELSMPATAKAAQAVLPLLRAAKHTSAKQIEALATWTPKADYRIDYERLCQVADGAYLELTKEQKSFISMQAWFHDIDDETAGRGYQEIAEDLVGVMLMSGTVEVLVSEVGEEY